VAADGALYAEHADWFHPLESEEARLDPRHVHREDNVAYANFNDAGTRAALADWWTQQLLALADAGIGGFRFDSPHRVPAEVWRHLRDAVRTAHPDVRFLAATPGLARGDLIGLQGAGFDSVFSSVRWWDYRASWMVEEHAVLARIGGPIAFPEAPYGIRLAAELSDPHDSSIVERAYRRALYAASAIGTGWMMPMGFEYGVSEPMSQTRGDASQFALACQAKKFDLTPQITRANELARTARALHANGELRALIRHVFSPACPAISRASLLSMHPAVPRLRLSRRSRWHPAPCASSRPWRRSRSVLRRPSTSPTASVAVARPWSKRSTRRAWRSKA
jgi:starch synthase (maltosyl-transferring)